MKEDRGELLLSQPPFLQLLDLTTWMELYSFPTQLWQSVSKHSHLKQPPLMEAASLHSPPKTQQIVSFVPGWMLGILDQVETLSSVAR